LSRDATAGGSVAGREVFAVVMAAGKGTRMKSERAKVLHEVAGRPLLGHVLTTLSTLGVDRSVVVVGHQADAVRQVCEAFEVDTVLQREQLGTGHAVAQARPLLEGRRGWTLVLSGDVPLLRAQTLRGLLQRAEERDAAAVVLSAVTDDPTGYGRILRGPDGALTGIVEEKDATEEQRAIREYNTGTYCFDNTLLWRLLEGLDRDNAQGEFYLTDLIARLVDDGLPVEGVICEDEWEVQGVNTVDDLRRAQHDWEEFFGG